MKITHEGLRVRLFSIAEFVLSKNASYGGAEFDPAKIFYKDGDEEVAARIRIDDKLKRFMDGNMNFENEIDNIRDLVGYMLILLILLEEKEENRKRECIS